MSVPEEPEEPGSPLPPKLPSRITSPTIIGAYPQILSLERTEKAAWERSPGDGGQRKRLMYARIVGYLILEAPSDQARIAVGLEVISCEDKEEILAIGQHYCDHLLYACKQLILLLLRHSESLFNSQKD